MALCGVTLGSVSGKSAEGADDLETPIGLRCPQRLSIWAVISVQVDSFFPND